MEKVSEDLENLCIPMIYSSIAYLKNFRYYEDAPTLF